LGVANKAKIQLKGQGPALSPPALPLALPLRVQLVSAGGQCWESVFSAAGAGRNDGDLS
jgi:hypothetical protein